MKTYEFEITETLQKIEEVKANHFDEAYNKVFSMYKNEEIVLSVDNYITTDIKSNISHDIYIETLNNFSFQEFVLGQFEKTVVGMSTEEMINITFGDIENAINSFKNE
jgi:hypothetical protein